MLDRKLRRHLPSPRADSRDQRRRSCSGRHIVVPPDLRSRSHILQLFWSVHGSFIPHTGCISTRLSNVNDSGVSLLQAISLLWRWRHLCARDSQGCVGSVVYIIMAFSVYYLLSNGSSWELGLSRPAYRINAFQTIVLAALREGLRIPFCPLS
jgi:hypothetical protein